MSFELLTNLISEVSHPFKGLGQVNGILTCQRPWWLEMLFSVKLINMYVKLDFR